MQRFAASDSVLRVTLVCGRNREHAVNDSPFGDNPMRLKPALCLALAAAAALPLKAADQRFSHVQVEMFRTLKQKPNDLARFDYLTKVAAFLSEGDQSLALQLLASTENELGLYNEAIRDFPLKSQSIAHLALPSTNDWMSADAAEVVAKMAAGHRIIMVNEAHHDAHTRQLSIELLEKLKAQGFTYFAAEALGNGAEGMTTRGYPIFTDGSEYLHEPIYGELIRQAIRLGYKIVPYDSSSSDSATREHDQAVTLAREVFDKDPQAKLFVHAGYAHIDKSVGRLGSLHPMAMQLAAITGLTPISVDQTQFREQIPSEEGPYQTLVATFKPDGPTVLVNRQTGRAWSASPSQYDATVILPPSGMGAVESGSLRPWAFVTNNNRNQSMWTRVVNAQRPEWLKLDGLRRPYAITSTLCKTTLPCVVEARLEAENAEAVPMDRYTFTLPETSTRLFLQPGKYRLIAWGLEGGELTSKSIEISR